MRELTSIILEMERQSKHLGELLRVGRLNTMRQAEFSHLVAIADRLMVNLADFNALHFGHGEAQVGPKGHMASWKRQKEHQQEVGCVPRQNIR